MFTDLLSKGCLGHADVYKTKQARQRALVDTVLARYCCHNQHAVAQQRCIKTSEERILIARRPRRGFRSGLFVTAMQSPNGDARLEGSYVLEGQRL